MAKKSQVKIGIFVLAIAIAAYGAYRMAVRSDIGRNRVELHVLCGAGFLHPMEELIAAFEKKHSVKTIAHYGGSGELMGQLSMGGPCDVFIPGADKYIDDAKSRGWIDSDTVRNLVLHIPVIVVTAGNPKKIEGIEDLVRPGISIALGDPDACAIGRVADAIFDKNRLKEAIQKNVKTRTPTVNQLLVYVALGRVDAAIIWEDMVLWPESKDNLAVVSIPANQNSIKKISIAVAKKSKNKVLATAFCEFVDSDEGRRILYKWGFKPCRE